MKSLIVDHNLERERAFDSFRKASRTACVLVSASRRKFSFLAERSAMLTSGLDAASDRRPAPRLAASRGLLASGSGRRARTSETVVFNQRDHGAPEHAVADVRLPLLQQWAYAIATSRARSVLAPCPDLGCRRGGSIKPGSLRVVLLGRRSSLPCDGAGVRRPLLMIPDDGHVYAPVPRLEGRPPLRQFRA